MSKATLTHTTQAAQIIILTRSGPSASVVPLTVAAIVAWFLSCVPAQFVAVQAMAGCVQLYRGWLWWTDWQAWREEWELTRVALCMAARLEFA